MSIDHEFHWVFLEIEERFQTFTLQGTGGNMAPNWLEGKVVTIRGVGWCTLNLFKPPLEGGLNYSIVHQIQGIFFCEPI